jgi:hypothetical protein
MTLLLVGLLIRTKPARSQPHSVNSCCVQGCDQTKACEDGSSKGADAIGGSVHDSGAQCPAPRQIDISSLGETSHQSRTPTLGPNRKEFSGRGVWRRVPSSEEAQNNPVCCWRHW